MKTTIIMPCCDALEYTELAISSLFRHTTDFELIVIDNGTERVPDRDNIIIIQNQGNVGYPESVNQGFEEASGDYLCVVNNDLVFPPHWLERMIAHIERGRLDMIGPVCNSISGLQQRIIDVYDGEEDFYKVAEEHYQKEKGNQFRYHRLVGFCLLLKREIYEKIGGFDPVFSPGNFEDDDYSLRAIQAGFRLGVAKDVFLHHFGSVTHKLLDIDYQTLLNRNRKIFDSMWSFDVIKQMAIKNREA